MFLLILEFPWNWWNSIINMITIMPIIITAGFFQSYPNWSFYRVKFPPWNLFFWYWSFLLNEYSCLVFIVMAQEKIYRILDELTNTKENSLSSILPFLNQLELQAKFWRLTLWITLGLGCTWYVCYFPPV